MRIKLTLNRPDESGVNVAVTADATATVRDVAEALFSGDPTRSGAPAPENLTLQVVGDGSTSFTSGRVLTPTNDLVQAGLRSGSVVSIVRVSEQFVNAGQDRGTAVAQLRVLDGPDAGREFPLPVGTTYIGRDRGMDVRLSDGQVSKRHARVVVGESIEVHDLASANGLVMGGKRTTRAVLTSSDTVTLGETTLSVVALHRSTSLVPTSPVVEFNRSPRVVTRFGEIKIKAPKPPKPVQPQRLPWLMMLAPMAMGAAMYSVTRNPMSLMFMFMSPVMMVGMYFDRKMYGKKQFKEASENFERAVVATSERIDATHSVERAVRLAESPSLAESLDAVRRLGGLMWTHRPEHRSFLSVRFGLGSAPSRTEFDEPRENDAVPEHWQQVLNLQQQCITIHDVPMGAGLRYGGNIGIAGPSGIVEPVGRSVLLQIAALHSPADVVVTALTSARSRADWEWLEWLPHTGSPHSPLGASDHLADDSGSGISLLTRLEELVEGRGVSLDGHAPLVGEMDAEKNRKEAPPKPLLPSVVVLVEDDAPVERARLVRLAEHGAAAGVYVVWIAPTVEQLPAACRTFVLLNSDSENSGAMTGEVHYGQLAYPVRCEVADLATAREVARILSPVVDVGAPTDDESDLPRAVSYLALAGTEMGKDSNTVVERWRENLSLTPRDGSPPVRRKTPTNLRALIGHDGVEPFHLDLRTQGPHALVGGTTGAGKSEFLQSWVLGMAAAHSPDRVTFLFVDYKGGAAFADCVHLPHTVGLVTDLSPHLVRRALSSLRAELHYREHLLNRKKAKDLASLERTGDPEAPPSLIIVVDEFAALVGEVPEFVDGVIDVAQRGRSLGLHLILATQRPAGVIKDSLRANTNLRIALRMADEHDSKDVLGDDMAAHFSPSIPGRGAAKTGPGRLTTFQTGYAGGWTKDEPERSSLDVEEMDFGTGRRWELPAPEVIENVDPGPNDIARMVSTIRRAASDAGVPTPRKPWLEELAATYDLALLPNRRTDSQLVLGVLDNPPQQAQPTVHYEPDTDGNLAIYGTGGTGKSTTLRTIAVSAGLTHRGGPVQVYGIDCGSGGLSMLENLPHVGAVISGDDEERVTRLMRRLRDTLDQRSDRFAAVRAATIDEYRRLANKPDEPRIIVLVDGIGAFREAYENITARGFSIFGTFTQLATDGRPVGIHLVMTGDRAVSVPPSLASTVQKRIVHRMAKEDDYIMLNVPKDVLTPASAPGRAIMYGQEAQIAVLGGDSNAAVQSRELARLEQTMRTVGGVPQAPGIERLPDTFTLDQLPQRTGELATIGLRDLDIAPVGLPLRGPLMVAGPPGSGRTTAFVTLATALRRNGAGRLVYLSSRRSSLSALDLWDMQASSPEDVVEALKELTTLLESDRTTPGTLTVMVENYTELTGTPAEKPMEAFVKLASRKDQLVVGESESSTWSKAFTLAGPFKSGRNGLLLTPGDSDGDVLMSTPLGRIRRKDFPPGRGFLVTAGRATKIHVALPG